MYEERIEMMEFEGSYSQQGLIDVESWYGTLEQAIAHYMEWRFVSD
jgi:hypothetical protein